MEIKLDVLVSTCIKHRKPWPRISWLGQEKEAIFLIDNKCISEINLVSGKTKKKIPRLQSLLKNVVVIATSRNGAWLAGILSTGELFLWNKDQDYLKTVPAIEESRKVITAAQECSMRLYLYVSGDGNKVLLTTPTACVFLWESTECKDISSAERSSLAGHWSQIIPEESVILPSTEDKETGMNADFIKNEILGDCCLCSFMFYSGECLMLTFLALRWHENSFRYVSSLSYHILWAQQACYLSTLVPVCMPVKSRGALLTTFSRDGLLLAVAINQNDPKATQILFINTLNFVTVSGNLKGCSSKNHVVSSKFVRSYWVGDMSWTPDSLFLACMLKRGSLILLTCMGELLTLVTSGCSIEFGPAEFIPFHPLITYRLQQSLSQDSNNHSLGSSASESDLMRQRFSVTSHSRLPYLIVSDGYMLTVLRFSDNLSPSGVMRSLLLDSAQRLEKIHQDLRTHKSKGKRLQLRSLSSLKASLLKQYQNHNSAFPTIPKFLQKEETAEHSEKTADLQDYDDESDDDKQFQNISPAFCSQRPDSFFSSADQGQLEFASMFDTVHAKDDTNAKDDLSMELNSIKKNLLAAWGIGISKNLQEKDILLNYTVGCITHFFNILQFIESPLLSHVAFLNKSVKTNLWMHCILKHFYQCLTVFYWDVTDRRTVGHLVKLTLQTLKLLLIQKQDQFSNYLLGCFYLLKMVAHSLNGKSIPHYEMMSAVSDVNNSLELDSLIVPIFQVLDGSSAQKFHSLNSLLKIPPQAIKLGVKPENRLMILWRLLYKQVLCYQTQLNRKISQIGKLFTEMKIAHEESVVAELIGHIQAVLQSSGETLEQTWKLNSVIGEEQFLLGSYEESLDLWKRALQETKAKGEKRTQFLQTRYYLAILYCHLYHYNLREAQGLSDHLVKEVLKRSQLPVRKADDFTDGECFQYELWMIRDVHPDAAAAVIKSMARFMAAYFTNQLLYVLPPHKVDILPPLHINQGQFPRVVPLQHSVVTSAVRDQNLSSVWTAEYALDLLFVGGLIPEAVWLARKLGDWKMSVTIGVAYKLYCQSSSGVARSEKMELHLPLNLTPTHIFQEKLQSFLGQPVNFETSNEGSNKYKHFTDPIEEEDGNVLFGSVQEILKAAVMADADILSETFQLLMDSAKDLSRKLCGLVPDGLYLPAPPLYCPQPASLSEEDYNDLPLKIERDYRQKVSGVLQRILLLFRAARCSFPVAQWYIVKLKWARKVMQKIRMKGNLPSLSSFPDTLLRYSKLSTIFFRPASSGDHRFDDVSCKAIGCFRELCALCWMLHVRERLSDCCRKYQTARETVGNQKDYKKAEYDAHIVEHSLNAMEWACRMLPFARFMNVEELVQDIILSLVGELPPIRKVAEILVKAFPNSEDVRVPLRDKYHALQQRLRHCIVRGPKSEEMMSVVVQATHKMRMKALKRVIRNIGPIEISIWEPSEEETPDDEAHCYDRFSLGTSLSRSTLSDCGNPQVYSDAETTDTLSEALLAEGTRDQAPSPQRETWPHMEEQTGRKNTAYKIRYLSCKAKHKEKEHTILPNHHTLPVVGAWEFERDDDEYVKFLDLFLSYVLERDLVNCSDPGIPFLISFSEPLREHELHSLLFDVHTTLKRRQGKTNSQNVFRAGCCYAVTRASCDSKPVSLCNEKQKCLENQMSVSVLKPADSSMCDSMNGVKKYMGKKGLFGLNHLSVYRAQDNKQEITITPITQTLSDHACSSLQTSVTYKYMYKTIHVNDVIPREELGLELKNEFSNIARLLEWMIRWSDRRLLCDTNTFESFQESRPMLHVKTSAAAILTSLWLLGLPFCDELQAKHTNFKNPDYHYLMNSASLPETRSKIQKKSSVNSSCSPSTETPHAVQDVNAHDEPCENVLGICTETKHSKKNEMNENYSVTHSTEGGVIDFDEVGAFQEVDKTSENEELFEELFGAPKSPSISVSIKLVQQKEEHISTLDVESPWEEPMMEKLEGKIAKQNGTVPHSFGLEMNADAPSVPYDGPGCSNKQEVQEGELIAEPSDVSEAVRQMLQNEMFKLVQLQQINFLSLMQIVGSSFASLPNVQHILQQPQSIQLGGNQALHTVRSNCADTFVPIQSTDIFSETQLPSKENVGKSKKSSSHPQERNILNDQTSKESTHNHPDVNISLSLSESQSNGMGFIQAPENLLPSAPAKLLHLLSPSVENQKTSKLIPIAKSLRYENGFPLLKLESDRFKSLNLYPLKVSQAFIRPLPQPRVAWDLSPSLQNPPLSCTLGAKTNSTTCLNKYHEISQVREEKKRWSEAKSRGPPKLLNHNPYEEEQNLPPRHYLHTNVNAEKPLSAQHASFYGTYQHSAGIPLLHLQLNPAPRFPPITRPPIPASLIPIRSVTEETNSRDKLQHTGLSILHADLPPRNKFQSPKLIPLQNLIAFEKSRQCTSVPQDFIGQAHPVQIELLKASTEPFDTRRTQNNTKREKRRAEKQIKERADKKKASVTFRPDDSIISTDDVETEIQDQQAESSSYHGDSVLISPDTIGEAITTSAGLHYMASTMKKPAETQDASTNTDTVLKSNQDIETGSEDVLSEHLRNRPITSVPTTEHLTSSVPQTLPPDMYLNFRFHTAVGETLLPSSVSDTAPDVIGHNYINVIDIEESDLLKDLPVIAESAEEIITAQQHENFTIPSSAKLHHMAASVTNAIPPNEFQRQDGHQNILIPVQEEDIKVDSGRDNLTWNLLHHDVSIIHSEGLSAKIISKEHFCTKLQEMDIQLQALQNIAENMEKDFSNTKLIVKTIEDLGMIDSPDVGAASLFSDGVGVIDEAHYVSSVDFEDRMDEEEEGSRPEYSADSYTALHAHSLSPATSAANLPSHLKSSSDIHIHEDLGDSFTDDPLQITGLSCITDTVNDLVTEGGVSPTEMSITKTQDKKIFRIYDTAAGYSQKTKRERKEIQVWMKRKRKERLEEYRKKVDEQRQREYNPFNLKNNTQFGLTAKEIKLSQKKKDEKDKALLSEHHSLRVSQALSLMNEMLSETVQLPASESRPLSKTTIFPRDFRKQHLISARGSCPGSRSLSASQAERSRTAAKPGFGQARSHSTPPYGLPQSRGTATGVLQKNISEGGIRNATHYPGNSRPVAIRPQDQTSQLTRRGMLTDFNRRRVWLQGNASQRMGIGKGRPNSARQASDYLTVSTKNLRRPAPHTIAIQTEDRGLNYESERDSVSPWSVPDDIQRILHDNYDSLLEVAVPHEEDFSPLSVNEVDSISESTGSILSKLDWNAVEAMVANMEEN